MISPATFSQLVRGVTKDQEAVLIAIDATSLVAESLARTEAWPPSMIHLGQGLMAAALMAALPDRNEKERWSLQWNVSGPFGPLYVECRDQAQVRGTIVHPQVAVNSLNESLGTGTLAVRRRLGTSFQGIVDAQGRVALDLIHYLEQSEQKNCAADLWVKLAWDEADNTSPVKVVSALGYLVHVLPQKNQMEMERRLLRWDEHLRNLGPVSSWVLNEGKRPMEILSLLSGEFAPAISFEREVEFFCDCSEQRAYRAYLLSEQQMSDEEKAREEAQLRDDDFTIRCEFCGREYGVPKEVT